MLFHAREGTLSRFRPLTRKRLIHRIIYTNKNNNVMNKKKYLEAPLAELIDVRLEDNFLGSIESKSIQSLEYDDDELNC